MFAVAQNAGFDAISAWHHHSCQEALTIPLAGVPYLGEQSVVLKLPSPKGEIESVFHYPHQKWDEVWGKTQLPIGVFPLV